MTDKRFKELVKDGFYVEVNNRKEAMAVLKMCEKHDVNWATGGKATSYNPNVYPYLLHISKDWINNTVIFYLNAKDKDRMNPKYRNINIKEFITSKQEIHITRKGSETHAILKEDGKVIKHTVAKCHPDDKYDFKVGSKLAYDRLFEKDNKDEKTKNVKATKPKHEFKVGDIVRIRQWDDMVKEFKMLGESIKCTPPYIIFNPKMRKYCCELCEITSIHEKEIELNFLCKEFKDIDKWIFTTDMIEPYTPRIAKVGEHVKILKTGKIVKCDHDTEYWGEKIFKCDEGDCIYLKPEEYEVLDDYIPPLNCRFIPTEDTMGLTKGKIYEVKKGKFKDDDGDIFPVFEELLNEEDLKKYFLPLMEDSEIIIVIKD